MCIGHESWIHDRPSVTRMDHPCRTNEIVSHQSWCSTSLEETPPDLSVKLAFECRNQETCKRIQVNRFNRTWTYLLQLPRQSRHQTWRQGQVQSRQEDLDWWQSLGHMPTWDNLSPPCACNTQQHIARYKSDDCIGHQKQFTVKCTFVPLANMTGDSEE